MKDRLPDTPSPSKWLRENVNEKCVGVDSKLLTVKQFKDLKDEKLNLQCDFVNSIIDDIWKLEGSRSERPFNHVILHGLEFAGLKKQIFAKSVSNGLPIQASPLSVRLKRLGRSPVLKPRPSRLLSSPNSMRLPGCLTCVAATSSTIQCFFRTSFYSLKRAMLNTLVDLVLNFHFLCSKRSPVHRPPRGQVLAGSFQIFGRNKCQH